MQGCVAGIDWGHATVWQLPVASFPISQLKCNIDFELQTRELLRCTSSAVCATVQRVAMSTFYSSYWHVTIALTLPPLPPFSPLAILNSWYNSRWRSHKIETNQSSSMQLPVDCPLHTNTFISLHRYILCIPLHRDIIGFLWNV